MSNTYVGNEESGSSQFSDNRADGNRGGIAHLQEAAQNIADKTSDLANQATQKTEGAISAVGEGINHLGDRVRDNLPDAVNAVADGLNSSGKYLETHGFEEMANDLTEVVKRHPMPAVWLGVGAGFLLGLVLHRRN